MEPSAPLDYADLLDEFEWVSASADGENSAYVCRATGATYFTSSVFKAKSVPAIDCKICEHQTSL